jgi:hypothetical protein
MVGGMYSYSYSYSYVQHRVVVPARQATKAGGPVPQPYARVDYIPQSRIKNWVSDPWIFH